MNSIAIDLATATNVLSVTVSLFVLSLNLLILARLQQISVPIGTDPASLIPRLGSPSKTKQAASSSPLQVHSASDQRMAEREQMKKEAEKLEELAMGTEYR